MSSLEQGTTNNTLYYGYTVNKWISLTEWNDVPSSGDMNDDDADKFFLQRVQYDGDVDTNGIGLGLEKYKQETKKYFIELREWAKGQVTAMILSEAQKQQLKCR
jgi:hypothetical protein